MIYVILNTVFLALVIAVATASVVARRLPHWRAVGLTAIPLVILTAVFDNVLVAVGIVAYDPHRISGAHLGVAPLEDFAYPLAAVVLLPCLWSLLTPRRSKADA